MSYVKSPNFYDTVPPGQVYYPGSWRAPFPGWGVRPEMAGPRRISVGGLGATGLGYNITVGTPIGNQTFSIPIEKMASDAGQMAIDAAWPPMKAKLEAELPTLISKLEAELPTVMAAANKSVVTNLWPQMQPKLRVEVDYALGEAKKTGMLIGGMVAGAVILSTLYLRKVIRTPR